MSYFPFEMHVSRRRIISRTAVLALMIIIYLTCYRFFTLPLLCCFAAAFILMLAGVTDSLISVVDVDIDSLVINTLLTKDRVIAFTDVTDYKYMMGHCILTCSNGRHYILPPSLSHEKRFRSTLDFYIGSNTASGRKTA